MTTDNIPRVTVRQTQVEQSINTDRLCAFVNSAISDGARLVCDSRRQRRYYLTTKVQFSAQDGEVFVRVDRELAQAIAKGLESGGRISEKEVFEIMSKLTDAGRYTQGEAILARLLLAATDDRKRVEINDDRINLTDRAEDALKKELYSFWGKIGAAARWGRSDPANAYLAA